MAKSMIILLKKNSLKNYEKIFMIGDRGQFHFIMETYGMALI